MSNSINPQIETLDPQPLPPQSSSSYSHGTQEWGEVARAWLSTMPDDKTLTASEVQAWLDSSHASLPEQLKSMPLPELCERLASMRHHSIVPYDEEKDANLGDLHPARFQRTDQWRPVYSWLESLETDEVVKSKDILDWLAENPEVKEQLYSRHSRYHLMHYIKKCHVKIVKRKERKKGLQSTSEANSMGFHSDGGAKVSAPTPTPAAAPAPAPAPAAAPAPAPTPTPAALASGNTLSNLPRDSDMYLTKRNEALHKFEILVELEKQLSIHLPKRESQSQQCERVMVQPPLALTDK